MHELFVQLLRYARGVWRYRWWMLGVAWVICLVGWIIVARMPDQYEATARVYVDTQSVLRPLLKGLAIDTGNSQKKILLMTRTLLSQPNLEQVLRMTDLDLKVKTEQDKEDMLATLRKGISLRGARKENLYTISYKGDSPDVAKLVVKSLLTIFMESNLGEVRKDQDSATLFLEQQIGEYERRMRDMEQTITRFKQRNLGFLPNETGGYYERIRQLKAQQAQAELEVKIIEDRAASLRGQLEGESPSFGLGPPEQSIQIDTAVIDRRINAMEARLDELLLKYTEKHPDVISTRQILKDLEAQKKQEVAEARRELKKTPQFRGAVAASPFVDQLRIALSQAEADIAAKKVVLEESKKRIQELTDGIDKVLRVEAEHSQLMRDYQSLKSTHATMMSRLEAAKLGRRADTTGDTVQFKIIDPPRVPSTPSGPNRIFFSSSVLLIGLAVGFAVAFLMSQLRPTFDERKMLTEVLGIPVLGSVNMVWTLDQIRARKVRNASFAFSMTALVVSFGAVLALYQLDIDLLPRLAKSLDLS